MRQNDHYDNFELFLREATAHFKMKPSVKVWNSIYNNFHPSRKTPSISAIFLFLASFLLLDHNNHEIHTEPLQHNLIAYSSEPTLSRQVETMSPIDQQHEAGKVSSIRIKAGPIPESGTLQVIGRTDRAVNDNLYEAHIETTYAKTESADYQKAGRLIHQETEKTETQSGFTATPIKTKSGTGNDLSYQFYATSSVGYINSYKNNESSGVIDEANTNWETGKYMKLSPELNLEAGGAFLMNITSSLKLKAGMQLNYTNYKLTGEEFSEDLSNTNSPINNTPVVKDNQLMFGNTDEKKYSSTYQISIPFGTELELAGNRQLKWFAGATIQPSYLVGGSPYGTGTDIRNYYQSGLFRKWNVNTSFETFVSYRLPNGSSINAGPQFRYQLFSTYDSRYYYSEKLYNIGLKLGISKNL